ncbi:DUF2806 domain-containing protein [Rhodospira trueperi]|uniref:Uncharacterized protein n=1 Tax=Rhodospira trueperi TaxID=69960 RepID=A0A1G7G279_9PROT|nr:DUF2806 domain-containing protein [Rhodospira trueperi]SDE82246.1 Protein of unknown function [Rhodospira trueperi]
MEPSDDEATNLPESLTDALDGLDGIPAPIKRSIFKALSSLITGCADVPAAWLEDKAARIRSRTRNHELIMAAAGRGAANKATSDPEIVDRALEYHANHLVASQINREAVAYHACEAMRLGFEGGQKNEKSAAVSHAEELDEDWLTQFNQVASIKSNEDIQLILGRILAGEVSRPGTFSPLTIQALSVLDQKTASLFDYICNCALVNSQGEVMVIYSSLGSDRCKSIKDDLILRLQTHGLVGQTGIYIVNPEQYSEKKEVQYGEECRFY